MHLEAVHLVKVLFVHQIVAETVASSEAVLVQERHRVRSVRVCIDIYI